MLVFGDHAEARSSRSAIDQIGTWTDGLPADGLPRHSMLVGTLIEAGRLAQGIADAVGPDKPGEDPSGAERASMRLLAALAAAVSRSYDRAFAPGPIDEAGDALQALSRSDLPAELSLTHPEGYGFYALYPEGYLAAARAAASELSVAPVQVIGIRSIGTSLAAMVAAGLGAAPPVTVRPTGHPFSRELKAARGLAALLGANPDARFAIVDEGPGLSGSSFLAVASFLERQGVGRDRLRLFPSHAGGPGGQASAEALAMFAEVPSHCVSFDALWLQAGDARHLAHWASDLIGEPNQPLEDISGGGWRRLAFGSPSEWPPSELWRERRKFLARTPTGTWLLKFSGLGEVGQRKLVMARQLAAAGFTAEIAGERHGFLIQRWIEDARPLNVAGTGRAGFLKHLAGYLAFRARAFGGVRQGASIAELFEMMRFNAEQALGPAASALDDWWPALPRIAAAGQPVAVDGRLHRHEWLRLPDGRILKMDALDHHAGHDLVGCQDIAWDLAGAVVEFDLAEGEARRLRDDLQARIGSSISAESLSFHECAYLAFHLGRITLAAQALAGCPDELQRMDAERHRYADRLSQRLGRRNVVLPRALD